DPYDAIFGDGSDMMEIDMPEDSSIDDKTRNVINKFRLAEDTLKLESCLQCLENWWNSDVKDGECHRCHHDKSDTKPWSKGNNVCPSPKTIALTGLTELEEQMISLDLSVMSVRYTKG
ncbi:hypothetical protein K435DRAFT_601472, partial [Dendrothele bispora CBS 962.96]